ncbi:MAG: MepB family protein [Parachlamydiaceae bacterium]|nr:MepB family protein [Parachlamydiaceae bacterium]
MITHPDLHAAIQLIYEPCGLVCSNNNKEEESEEYGASTFNLSFDSNLSRIKFRIGKITPTKIGQFVTFWKRNIDGIIIPHDFKDPFDFFVVNARKGDHFGQFVFPKEILLEEGIISNEGQGGKLGTRIYPPWDATESKQAKKTQAWQLMHFLEFSPNESVNISKVQKLFNYQ